MGVPIIGATSGAGADVDAAAQAFRTSHRPFDFGTGGSYQLTSKSGTMAAGLAANAPIYAFRNAAAATLVILRSVKISAWSLGTGFAAGLATLELFRASSWSAADTGGTTDTITTVNGKMRTTMPSIAALAEIRHSSTAALTPGTRTLDAQPHESLNVNVTTATNTAFVSFPTFLFQKMSADYPLVFGPSEGFVIQATVPATGLWSFAITPVWDEAAAFAP